MENISSVKENLTTIAVKKITKKKLENLGKFGESFDDVVRSLIDEYDRKDTV